MNFPVAFMVSPPYRGCSAGNPRAGVQTGCFRGVGRPVVSVLPTRTQGGWVRVALDWGSGVAYVSVQPPVGWRLALESGQHPTGGGETGGGAWKKVLGSSLGWRTGGSGGEQPGWGQHSPVAPPGEVKH